MLAAPVGSACGQPMRALHVFLPHTVFTLPATERLEFVTKVLRFGLEHTLTVLLPSCPQLLLLCVPIPWDCLTFLKWAGFTVHRSSWQAGLHVAFQMLKWITVQFILLFFGSGSTG